jgi:predicted small lipoprotein YifL
MTLQDRTFYRLALIGVLAAALGLAACGRKGPLDPPPSAAAGGEAQQAGTAPGEPGPKKPLPIDVLLN